MKSVALLLRAASRRVLVKQVTVSSTSISIAYLVLHAHNCSWVGAMTGNQNDPRGQIKADRLIFFGAAIVVLLVLAYSFAR